MTWWLRPSKSCSGQRYPWHKGKRFQFYGGEENCSSGYWAWSLISSTKLTIQFVTSKVRKDTPTSIYSDTWESPLDGEFTSTGQGSPVWRIHLSLGCNKSISDIRDNGSDDLAIKSDPDAISPQDSQVSSEEVSSALINLILRLENRRFFPITVHILTYLGSQRSREQGLSGFS